MVIKIKLIDALGIARNVFVDKTMRHRRKCDCCSDKSVFVVFKYRFNNEFVMICKFSFYCKKCFFDKGYKENTPMSVNDLNE